MSFEPSGEEWADGPNQELAKFWYDAITEKENEREDTKTETEVSSVATSEKSTTKDLGLTVSALVFAPIRNVKEDQEYALVASKRVLGALNVSVMVTTDKKIGAGLGWSF